MDMSTALNMLALPCMLVLTAGLSWLGVQGAAFIRERTHNELLARLAEGAGRIAGSTYEQLRTLPQGANASATLATLKQAGTVALQVRFKETMDKLGAPPEGSAARAAVTADMIQGELGKLTASSPTEGLAGGVLVVASPDMQATLPFGKQNT